MPSLVSQYMICAKWFNMLGWRVLQNISEGIVIASDRRGPRCRVCVSTVHPFRASSIKIAQGQEHSDSHSWQPVKE